MNNAGGVRPSYTHGGNAPVRVNGKGKSAPARAKKPTGRSKKKSSGGSKLIAAVLAVLVLAGAGFGLYKTGFFDPKYEITMADGTVQKVSGKQLRAMLEGDTFIDGIIINGTSVSGMTKEQALRKYGISEEEYDTKGMAFLSS